MRRINQTILLSSLLALGCSADVGGTGGQMDGLPAASTPPVTPGVPTNPVTPGETTPSPTTSTTSPVTPGVTPNPVTPGVTPTTPEPTATACQPGVPTTSQVPRLSNAQYERTVFDLLGVESNGLLAAEQEGAINKTIWDSYISSAKAIAKAVMADATLKSKFMTCTPEGDGAECLASTIVDFGARAYRRPLNAEEIADFDAHILAKRADITESNTPDQVAELILTTFLQSPSFLQREELGEATDANGNFTLTGYEVASRLSYLLWGSMPDDELFLAAKNDALKTKEQVLAQAVRMLDDDKARFISREFHDKYVQLTDSQKADRWAATMKSSSLFPAFVPQVTGDMIIETQMLFDDVFTSGGTFQDLFLTKNAFVTSRTAPIYGVTGTFGDTPTKTTLDDTRPGFLTRIGFLAAFSNQERNNPIIRGAFITKDVLGVDPGNPDPNVGNTPLPDDPTLDTLRKRVDSMTSGDGCVNCHTYVNPPGFVLEAFDASGAAQTTDRTVVTAGAPLDTAADIMTSYAGTPVHVETPAALMETIAAAPGAQRLYASKWVSYAFDRVLTGPDLCTVDALSTQLAAGGYSIKDLMTDLTQQDYFLARKVEVTQ
jgi:hypothetical protein